MATRQPAEESLLFDLPLDDPPRDEAARSPQDAGSIAQAPLPLTPPEAPSERETRRDAEPGTGSSSAKPPTFWLRAVAGLIDLAACTAVLAILLLALQAMGVSPAAADWPAAVLFLLAFSFPYQVLPLAFWGRTPGMAAAGIRSASRTGGPLTLRQAVLSWLASVITVALAGLPLLLALGGRSLGDLMSGTATQRLAR